MYSNEEIEAYLKSKGWITSDIKRYKGTWFRGKNSNQPYTLIQAYNYEMNLFNAMSCL